MIEKKKKNSTKVACTRQNENSKIERNQLNWSYLIVVPRARVLPRGSFDTWKESESDSQIYWSSSLCLEVTITLSATEIQFKQFRDIFGMMNFNFLKTFQYNKIQALIIFNRVKTKYFGRKVYLIKSILTDLHFINPGRMKSEAGL